MINTPTSTNQTELVQVGIYLPNPRNANLSSDRYCLICWGRSSYQWLYM